MEFVTIRACPGGAMIGNYMELPLFSFSRATRQAVARYSLRVAREKDECRFW